MLLVYALTLFQSALLMFLVQPMIGKMILPKFGGTPAVWNTCMAFFQALLLAGYFYADAAPKWLGLRRQLPLHIGLLFLPLIVLPIAVSESYAPPGEANPIPYVLALLLITVGLPFFVLSTSAPLLQLWFAHTEHPSAKDPYFLYAASNLGSMGALFLYPAVVEPLFTLRAQGWIWSGGYLLLMAGAGACAWLVYKSPKLAEPNVELVPETAIKSAETSAAVTAEKPESAAAVTSTEPDPEAPAEDTAAPTPGKKKKKKQKGGGPARASSTAITARKPEAPPPNLNGPSAGPEGVTVGRRLYWVALAFVPSSLMLGVTTYLTTDICAIPLLWVIPLALYLLTFILVFSETPRIIERYVAEGFIQVFFSPASRQRARDAVADGILHKAFVLVMPVAILVLLVMIYSGLGPEKIYNIFLWHLVIFFIVAMVCHGELARTRPPTRYLTQFYLLMSVGGLLGGIFNAFVAPLVFDRIAEYLFAMVVACLVLPPLGGGEKKTQWTRALDVGLPAVMALLAVGLIARRWAGSYSELVKLNQLREEEGLPPLDFTLWTPVETFLDQFRELMYTQSVWKWGFYFLVIGSMVYLLWAIVGYLYFSKKDLLDRSLDILVALSLIVLAIGIILRSPLTIDSWPIENFAEFFNTRRDRLVKIVAYGLPALFCYIFVERPVRFGFCVGAFLLSSQVVADLRDDVVLHRDRSFFGSIAVKRDGPYHRLVHGTTLHGKQYYNADHEILGAMAGQLMAENPLAATALANVERVWWEQRRDALTYYHRTGPIGQVMSEFERRKETPHYAVIGLGTGTMATYAQPGQSITYYEIDPAVRSIAENRDYFTYVSDARDRGAKLEIVMGDARLQFKNAPDGEYGLIVVDAFSSDAIPVHLITREAIELYLKKLAPDGILAFHISNRYLDLEPVLANIAEKEGLVGLLQNDSSDESIGKSGSHWVLLARSKKAFGELANDKRWTKRALTPKKKVGVWTDDFSNLLSVFEWGE